MNYEEAVLFKTALISIKKSLELEKEIRITPNDEEDFKFYLQDYNFSKTDDAKSKLYCSDGKYAVYSFYWSDRMLCYEKHIPES